MNKYIFVEFVFPEGVVPEGVAEIHGLGSDEFTMVSSDIEWDEDENVQVLNGYLRITGKIKAETATALSLSNSFLAKHMHTSYISDDLKNKFRK